MTAERVAKPYERDRRSAGQRRFLKKTGSLVLMHVEGSSYFGKAVFLERGRSEWKSRRLR
jgi:hypothetical protein